MNRRTTLLGLLAAMLAAPLAMAQAQEFPTRPITLVAPFPAGSVTDSVSRVLGQGLQEVLGQPVLVENRPGAQGTVGAGQVARAKPDGYTLLVASSGMFVANSLFKTLPYDPKTDFQPVSGVGSTSMIFLVPESSPIRTVADLSKAIQAANPPVTIGFGSPTGQLALAMFSTATKLEPVPVSYRGIPQALTDLIGGHVAVAIVDVGNGLAQIATGKARALAISAAARNAAAPDVPTLDEAFADASVSLETIIAILAPANTPPAVVERLDNAVRAVLAKPDVKTRLAALSIASMPLPTGELVKRIDSDVPKWEALIKKAGIAQQ